ncbi:aconitate hydratase, partial [Salmonella enterica]
MRLSIFNDCALPAHNKRSSTDRFPASAELAAVDTYRYLNFDQLSQ